MYGFIEIPTGSNTELVNTSAIARVLQDGNNTAIVLNINDHTTGLVIVLTSLPYATVKSLIAEAQQRP